jgi:glycosyltransferase involved in cell wall biosynthesis
MRRKHICLLSDHHICINPRVWKEALFFSKIGWDVTILTMWINEEHLAYDLHILYGTKIEYKNYLNLIDNKKFRFNKLFYRLRSWLSIKLFLYTGYSTKWLISYSPEKMVKHALALSADLYSAHLECGLYAGVQLLKRSKKVIFDFEDWYSRDYLVPERPVKFLSSLEHFALQNGFFCTAASESMAVALQKQYSVARKPVVIYNSFPSSELESKQRITVNEKNDIDIVWTSRTIGEGRGIEVLLMALSNVDIPVNVHFIGGVKEEYKAKIINLFPGHKGHNMIFHSFVKHTDLLPMIAKFDIGLAIEEYEPESRSVTVTNKILQYLQAGLLVLASDTDGQLEVSKYFPQSVKVVKHQELETWSKGIEELIRMKLTFDKILQKNIYDTYFSWERQEEKIMKTLIEYNLEK